ncbi:MAG: 23S rRNA pseudouridine(1911/1915/1917) synthase RluD [Gammaproteobacteria bacterium]|nr:23S rRNA pseudouridine(1911/1915/1917) synthase RluD [Gammaproteobacteria bacterium]
MLPAENQQAHQTASVPFNLSGRRLDQVLSVLFPDYSRSRLQQWLLDGHVQVDGTVWRAKDKVKGGEQIALTAVIERQVADAPEDLPLDVVYADEHLIVVNKPAGLVVHPAAGNRAGTLLNALLHYAPELAQLPRAGIVHRLDKDTTGLLVVARTLEAQAKLVTQLQARSVSREYDAVVLGVVVSGGTVDAPLGRHPVERKRMAVRAGGREAITHFRIVEHFRAHTHLRVQLETGRTHQIRVHLAHIHFPIVGDPAYGGRVRLPPRASEAFTVALRQFPRQALHASRLSLDHPAHGKRMQWRVPLPQDMQDLLEAMRDDADTSAEE